MPTNNKSKRVSLLAIFVALAMIFSYIEAIIPIPIAIPGVKLGLANLVVLAPLYVFGSIEALIISVVRILLVGFTFGNLFTMLYSFAGGMLSLFVMIGVKKIKGFSVVGVSICGGVTHNIGQLIVASIVLGTSKIIFYVPVLVISGAITGFLIGLLAKSIINRLNMLNL